jgi:hypothetical protein
MTWSPSPPKLKVDQVGLDIRVDSVSLYAGVDAESSFVVSTPGQAKRAWIEPGDNHLDQHRKKLHVSYTLPADGQPLSMTFHLWTAHMSAPRMPANAIVVQQSNSLFLLSAQEVAVEFGSGHAIYAGVPRRGAKATMLRIPMICQARWAREAPGSRLSEGAKAVLVYTSREGAEATDYYIVAVPTTQNNPRTGQAVRIQHDAQRVLQHWYAVPADVL